MLTTITVNRYISVFQWCCCYWLWTVCLVLTVVPDDANVCYLYLRYRYLTRKKNYFRSWWMKMSHWWELRGSLRWPTLITPCCQRRRRQRNAKHLILFLVSFISFKSLSVRKLFSDGACCWQFGKLSHGDCLSRNVRNLMTVIETSGNSSKVGELSAGNVFGEHCLMCLLLTSCLGQPK